MALSGGMIAALAGALGVGGYVLYQHRKAAGGLSQCQKIVAGAASLGGAPTNDALTKSVCDAASGILSAPSLAGAVSSLPGVQLASKAASAIVGGGADSNTCYTNGQGAPSGARYVAPGASVAKGIVGVPQAVTLPRAPGAPPESPRRVCYVVFSDQKATKVVGLMLRGSKALYQWSPPTTAPRSPLDRLGITGTLASAGLGTNTRDGQKATTTSTSSGGVLVTSTPRK